MKSTFISELSRKIANHKEVIQTNLKLYNQLKELPGVKYLEEITGKSLELRVDFWGDTEIRITEELHPDIMCSVAGEIEAECNFDCTIKQDIYSKRLVYEFTKIGGYDVLLQIILGHPVCAWVVEEETTEYYKTTDVRSVLKKGRMICD